MRRLSWVLGLARMEGVDPRMTQAPSEWPCRLVAGPPRLASPLCCADGVESHKVMFIGALSIYYIDIRRPSHTPYLRLY